MQITNEQKSVLIRALTELSDECEKRHIPPFELDIIGGFALMLHGVRKNMDAYTDVDYIGPELSEEIREMSKKIGYKYNLGAFWLNNDFLLSGNTLKDIEFSIGKLHFNDYYMAGNIKLNILNQKDLLKLKVIAIDTSLFDIEAGYEFSRFKDLNDIALLSESLNINLKSFIQDLDNDCLIINENTYKVINMYIEYGEEATMEYLDNYRKNHEIFEYDENLLSEIEYEYE